MLRLSSVEILLRAMPEAFLIILSIYTFSKTKLHKRRYFISVLIYFLLIISVRALPINYGVHTILLIIMLMFIGAGINKIDTMKMMMVSILTYIIIFICEGINVLLLQCVLGQDIGHLFEDIELKTLYGVPSLILDYIVVGICYHYLVKRKSKADEHRVHSA